MITIDAQAYNVFVFKIEINKLIFIYLFKRMIALLYKGEYMDKFIIHTLLLIFSLFVITDLHADTTDNAFRCSASKPTSEQNINVNILDCSYLHQFTLETFNHSLLSILLPI